MSEHNTESKKGTHIIFFSRSASKKAMDAFGKSLPKRKRENQMPTQMTCPACRTRIPNYPKGTCPKCGRSNLPAKRRRA